MDTKEEFHAQSTENIFNKIIKEEKLPNQGRETIQLQEAYRLSERNSTEELEGRMQELEDEVL